MLVPTRLARSFLALAVAGAMAAACRQKEEPPAPPPAQALRLEPAGTSYCDFDLSGDKADHVFFMLGMRNEMFGIGFQDGSDNLENFFCNEVDLARTYRTVAETTQREQGLEADLREETIQSCLTRYYSPSLSRRVRSCFKAEDLGPNRSLSLAIFVRENGGRPAFITERGLPDDVFYRRRALAYLSGAWARFHHEKDFAFSANRGKAELVAQLLDHLGCERISIESTVGYVPGGNFVHFQPTAEVSEWLRKKWP
jgi:hypothetical protein